jgi:hypothetical protein
VTGKHGAPSTLASADTVGNVETIPGEEADQWFAKTVEGKNNNRPRAILKMDLLAP